MPHPLLIEKLVFGGDGLGYSGGKAVFVPYTAPGDRITYEPLKQKKRLVKGKLLTVDSLSRERVSPQCPYFMRCGGCQWQHIDLCRQLQWKEDIFSSILAGKCGVEPEKILPIIPSPLEWQYRSRARLHVQFKHGSVYTGFFRHESHSICDIEHCILLDSRINTLLKLSRDLFSDLDFGRYKGRLETILEAGDSGGMRMIMDLSTRVMKSKRAAEFLEALMQGAISLSREVTFPASVIITQGKGNVLLYENGEGVQPPIIEPEKGIRLMLPARGFSQVNLLQNRTLVSLVKQAVEESRGRKERILDLFCGMGNFTIPLSFHCSEIIGVDHAGASIDAARENCKANGVNNANFLSEPVEAFVSSLDKGRVDFDIAILDPPRTGALKAVKAICKARIPHVIYVSCDPMTLSRDIDLLLNSGYVLRWTRPVDLFPHTYHIESVTVLELRS